MKKKFVVALVAAMSLTVAGTGTVFAMNNFHVHGDNCEWVVDKEAWHETVHHEEEGHYENGKLLEEEKGHYEEVVITPGWTENKYVVDKPAWTETVEHPEEGHYEEVIVQEAWDEEVTEILDVCHNCGHIVTSPEDWIAHSKQNINCSSYGSKEVTHIIHHEAVVEQQWKVDKLAWTETVEHPEEGHYEKIEHPAVTEKKWVVDKPAVYEQIWVVDKEAWDEIVNHPEEGHWVCNGEPQEPEQKPENPETPEQKPEANKENVQTQETETKKEGTSPKTGDTASALPVAGAGLASLGVALATILKKRK